MLKDNKLLINLCLRCLKASDKESYVKRFLFKMVETLIWVSLLIMMRHSVVRGNVRTQSIKAFMRASFDIVTISLV